MNALIKNNVILQQCTVMWMEILLLLRILTVLPTIWAWNRAGLVEDLWRNSLPVICDGNDKLQLFTRIHCQWPMRLETGHKRAMNRTVEDVAVLSRSLNWEFYQRFSIHVKSRYYDISPFILFIIYIYTYIHIKWINAALSPKLFKSRLQRRINKHTHIHICIIYIIYYTYVYTYLY